MIGSRLASLLIVVLLSSFICTLGISAWATTDDEDFPYLTEGIVSISQRFHDFSAQDIGAINATDHYFIHTEFSNPSDEAKSFSRVYYVALVIGQQDGYAYYAELQTYGNLTVNTDRGFSSPWVPSIPGNYTIRTFLISGLETPQVLSSAATSHVEVKEKIGKLAEGESNNRLQVESINPADNSVSIAYDFCNQTRPYSHEGEATLHLGDYVPINAVDAYFLGIEEDRAVFRFESNGGTDICLI